MKVATTTLDMIYYAKPYDIAKSVELLADSGVKHIDLNFWHFDREDTPFLSDGWMKVFEEAKKVADARGLDFVQAHSTDTSYEKGEKRELLTSFIKREIDVCGYLGIKNIVVHSICKTDGEREDFFKKNVEFYHELLPTAEKNGVTICAENTCERNAPTLYLFDGKDAVEMCERVNHQSFGFCWDVGHAFIQKVDQYDAITTIGKHLKALHIHDNNGIHDSHYHPYLGKAPFESVLNGLVDSDYKGYFTLEAFSLPIPILNGYGERPALLLDGVVYDRLRMLPVELKIRSEALMIDSARFMLDTYGRLED